jgi:hypothetical protein
MNTKLIAYVLFEFSICIAFFCFLYFTWIKDIQHLILKNQIERVFSDIANDLVIIDASNTLRQNIYSTLKNTLAQQRNTLLESDVKIEEANKSVLIESGIVISVFVLMGMGISIWLSKKYKFDSKDMILDGLSCGLTLSVVLIMFLYLVVNYYDLIDPNVVKKTILDVLIEYSKN